LVDQFHEVENTYTNIHTHSHTHTYTGGGENAERRFGWPIHTYMHTYTLTHTQVVVKKQNDVLVDQFDEVENTYGHGIHCE
jgi:hypothetical protein